MLQRGQRSRALQEEKLLFEFDYFPCSMTESYAQWVVNQWCRLTFPDTTQPPREEGCFLKSLYLGHQ